MKETDFIKIITTTFFLVSISFIIMCLCFLGESSMANTVSMILKVTLFSVIVVAIIVTGIFSFVFIFCNHDFDTKEKEQTNSQETSNISTNKIELSIQISSPIKIELINYQNHQNDLAQ